MNRSIALLSLLACVIAALPTFGQNLTYGPLSSPMLGGSSCPGDGDNDCLRDAIEDQLAALVAPLIFYDEDEVCVGGIDSSFDGGWPAFHFTRFDFFQVRPRGQQVGSWRSDGSLKNLTITYYFIYPHDCQRCTFFGGHQGDVEKVRFYLSSLDLVNWTLTGGRYSHHGKSVQISGSHIASLATGIGSTRPIVTASARSHGSYEGSGLGSSGCGKKSAGFLGICTDDCFCDDGTLASCFADGPTLGRFQNVATTLIQNIGEPRNLRTGPGISTVVDTDPVHGTRTMFVSTFNVGHGANREFWSLFRPEGFDGFCGWECPDNRREGESCEVDAHGTDKCIGDLYGKLDHTSYSIGCTYPCCQTDSDCFPEICEDGLCTNG